MVKGTTPAVSPALLSAERWTVGRVTVLSLFTTVQVFSMTSPLKVTLPSAACAATGESIIITTKDAIPLLYFFIFTPHHHAYGESFRKYPGVLYTYNLLILSPLD
jgi:hypothetical protein